MTKKKIFLKASPRAAEGIRRVYERKGADVSVQLQADGSITVIVVFEEGGSRKGSILPWRSSSRDRSIAA